jgi:uncharacterized membrane protein YgdD (TMEM256/DUF423 family)
LKLKGREKNYQIKEKNMSNKTIVYGFFTAIAIFVLAFIFEPSIGLRTAENIYAASGIGIAFFGSWACLRLIN